MTTRDEAIKALVCDLFEFGEDKWFDYADEFERFYVVAYKAGMERAAEIAQGFSEQAFMYTGGEGVDLLDGLIAAIREEAKKWK